MDSPLLSHPLEVRQMITGIVIVNNQPFKIKPRCTTTTTTTPLTTCTPTALPQTSHQIRAEYASLLRKAAFNPGTKTIAPVYDFDFREMISFAQTLKSHEVAAANRNRNLVCKVFVFDGGVFGGEGVRLLGEWVRCAEKIGLEVGYLVEWCGVEAGQLRALEGVVGGGREGRKILRALREWRGRREG
ncbi:hypothetical protein M409DRAFT_28263 [Zasmidium cellare ATCC 36951]|uniref:Uncharacterized protein n=1 Tax=Zasmidium cellare ATCC 36951 TaxID=1080233 RepID=A0A6A6C2A8_ZASCE|nr:uncharacterized protein M409DRAFT_28263 [Zasmidium cellare ATCC 36951]KAF2161224.1 hypothetical protein M409DRAFT_28263 [Zasmidium cellare ATCC 36951]